MLLRCQDEGPAERRGTGTPPTGVSVKQMIPEHGLQLHEPERSGPRDGHAPITRVGLEVATPLLPEWA